MVYTGGFRGWPFSLGQDCIVLPKERITHAHTHTRTHQPVFPRPGTDTLTSAYVEGSRFWVYLFAIALGRASGDRLEILPFWCMRIPLVF